MLKRMRAISSKSFRQSRELRLSVGNQVKAKVWCDTSGQVIQGPVEQLRFPGRAIGCAELLDIRIKFLQGTDQRATRIGQRIRRVLLCDLGLPFGSIFHDVVLPVVGGVDDMNALFDGKAKLFRVPLQSGVTKQPSGLGLPPCNESRRHFPAAIDPSAQFLTGRNPISLIDSPPQRRRLQPSDSEVEGEIDDGYEPALVLRGQHRAVAQRDTHRPV